MIFWFFVITFSFLFVFHSVDPKCDLTFILLTFQDNSVQYVQRLTYDRFIFMIENFFFLLVFRCNHIVCYHFSLTGRDKFNLVELIRIRINCYKNKWLHVKINVLLSLAKMDNVHQFFFAQFSKIVKYLITTKFTHFQWNFRQFSKENYIYFIIFLP